MIDSPSQRAVCCFCFFVRHLRFAFSHMHDLKYLLATRDKHYLASYTYGETINWITLERPTTRLLHLAWSIL